MEEKRMVEIIQKIIKELKDKKGKPEESTQEEPSKSSTEQENKKSNFITDNTDYFEYIVRSIFEKQFDIKQIKHDFLNDRTFTYIKITITDKTNTKFGPEIKILNLSNIICFQPKEEKKEEFYWLSKNLKNMYYVESEKKYQLLEGNAVIYDNDKRIIINKVFSEDKNNSDDLLSESERNSRINSFYMKLYKTGFENEKFIDSPYAIKLFTENKNDKEYAYFPYDKDSDTKIFENKRYIFLVEKIVQEVDGAIINNKDIDLREITIPYKYPEDKVIKKGTNIFVEIKGGEYQKKNPYFQQINNYINICNDLFESNYFIIIITKSLSVAEIYYKKYRDNPKICILSFDNGHFFNKENIYADKYIKEYNLHITKFNEANKKKKKPLISNADSSGKDNQIKSSSNDESGKSDNKNVKGEIKKINNKIDSMNNQIDSMNNRIDSMNNRIGTIEKNMSTMNNKIDALSSRMDEMDNSLKKINDTLNLLLKEKKEKEKKQEQEQVNPKNEN